MNEGDWTEKYELPREAERESRWHPDCHQQGCIKALHGGDHCPGAACAVKHTRPMPERPKVLPGPNSPPKLTVRISQRDADAILQELAVAGCARWTVAQRFETAVNRAKDDRGRMGL